MGHADDGTSVGSAVGLSVDGTSVGHADVGRTVGASVGVRDGVEVGTNVGNDDSIAGVNSVGVRVGLRLGTPVGANEGNHVGPVLLVLLVLLLTAVVCWSIVPVARAPTDILCGPASACRSDPTAITSVTATTSE